MRVQSINRDNIREHASSNPPPQAAVEQISAAVPRLLAMTNLPGKGQKIVYLDYDGVLHHTDVYWSKDIGFYLRAPDRYKLFQHVSLLEELLAPYPSISIVLSTSWVLSPHSGFEDARVRLTPALQERVIDCTHWDEHANPFAVIPRGLQVTRDVKQRQPSKWLAIDDDEDGWDVSRSNLVLSHQYNGIADKDVLVELKRQLAKLAA